MEIAHETTLWLSKTVGLFYLIAFYGILKAGAVHVPVNPLYKEHEFLHQLNEAQAEGRGAQDELRELGFPVFSVGTNPNGPTKFVPGRINWPISAGGIAVNLGIAIDEPGALREKLAGIRGMDMLVTIGGASVGDYDLVKQVAGAEGFAAEGECDL